jgi:hypothetical protein
MNVGLSVEAARFLTDADVNWTPCPDTWSDVHPRPGGAVIKADQEHELAVEETAEVEVPPVFEKVAANDPAMPEIVVVVTIMTNATKAVMVDIASHPVVTVNAVEEAVPVLLIEERPVVTAELAARAVQARAPTKARWTRWPT